VNDQVGDLLLFCVALFFEFSVILRLSALTSSFILFLRGSNYLLNYNRITFVVIDAADVDYDHDEDEEVSDNSEEQCSWKHSFELLVVSIAYPNKECNSSNTNEDEEECIEHLVSQVEVVIRYDKVQFYEEYKEFKDENPPYEDGTASVSERSATGHFHRVIILQVLWLLLLTFIVHQFLHIIGHF